MDSLAPVIGWLKRNKFWIGSALLSILMLVGWHLASTSMKEAKKKQISKYSQSFSSVQRIKKVVAVTVDDGAEADVIAHPNSATEEKMNEQLEATVEAVVEAWKLKRERQEPLMEFSKELLGAETYNFLKRSKAPELLGNGEHQGTHNEKFLKTYRQQIPKKVSEIARHIRANWAFDEQRIEEELQKKAKLEAERGAFGGMGGMGERGGGMMGNGLDTERNKFAVIWDQPNQMLWNTLLTEFQNWDDNVKASVDPTLLQVHMLQQDVWLLEAMFNAIRELNGNATTNDLAVIKEIRHIVFGREALASLGRIMEPDKRLGGAKLIGADDDDLGDEGYDTDYGMDSMDDFSSGFGEEDDTGVFSIDGDESPFHGRYVNVDLEPVDAAEIRNVVAGDELPEENLELIVSKRVPFRLAMKMDERKINSFLAICANSPFEFEVLQLRINRAEIVVPIVARGGKAENKSAADVEGMGGMMSGMSDMMSGMSDMMGGEGMGMMGMEAQKLKALVPTEVETRLSYDVDVEFYGVVKIYNPVRENYLRQAVGLPVEGEDGDSDAALESVAIRQR